MRLQMLANPLEVPLTGDAVQRVAHVMDLLSTIRRRPAVSTSPPPPPGRERPPIPPASVRGSPLAPKRVARLLRWPCSVRGSASKVRIMADGERVVRISTSNR